MTQEAKRIAIARAIGITVVPCTCTENPWKDAATGKHIPDYFGDLNAIREAVASLPRDQRNRYVNILSDLTREEEADLVDADFAWCEATATQRAESFGLALGLW